MLMSSFAYIQTACSVLQTSLDALGITVMMAPFSGKCFCLVFTSAAHTLKVEPCEDDTNIHEEAFLSFLFYIGGLKGIL